MDPTDEEFVRLGHAGRQLPIAIAAVVLLLMLAIAKPWASQGSAHPTVTTPPQEVVAVASDNVRSPAASVADRGPTACARAEVWQVVAGDVALQKPGRMWPVAAVEYSAVPPLPSTIPVVSLVSSALIDLGFCVPVGLSGPGDIGWSGTLWRQSDDATDPTAWRAVGRLDPLPGSFGALADPIDESEVVWPPGRYVLEARFGASIREAWLELVIQDAR